MGIIADILRRHASAALAGSTAPVPGRWYRAVQRITSCRTVRMGGCVDTCPDCGHVEFAPYSCRDRLCPICRGSEARSWLEACRTELLPVPYFHFVVTLPPAYSRAVNDHPEATAGELLGAVAEAAQAVAFERYGGELGILAVLHTWGRSLSWHAHVHCLIPGVVLRPDGSYKILSAKFLLPLGAFKKLFRAILTRRFRDVIAGFAPPGRVWRQKWNAKVRACIEGPRIVLRYLARYVRSGPLHEAQIVRADDQQVGMAIAVGIRVAPDPPHRSVREELPHTAPTSSVWRPSAQSRPKSRETRLTVQPAPWGARGSVRTYSPKLSEKPTSFSRISSRSRFSSNTGKRKLPRLITW